ncbi:MAG: hypothetical protein GXO56_00935 [Chloroflexi bacterium]|nr:hypothetical protein [Chloroflexota bacterium]
MKPSFTPHKTTAHKTPPQDEMPRFLWQGKFGPAFWTVSSLISMTINIVLIAILLIMAKQLFTLKQAMVPLVNGLDENFKLMDEAVITTHVEVHDEIPVVFDLPVKANTSVVLSRDVLIRNAKVDLRTGGLIIKNAPADIVLPKGTVLPIVLDITVPVNTQVPVDLDVPVNIPLRETDLHKPFVGLQQVVYPYKNLLDNSPNSWNDVCERRSSLMCDFFLGMLETVP